MQSLIRDLNIIFMLVLCFFSLKVQLIIILLVVSVHGRLIKKLVDRGLENTVMVRCSNRGIDKSCKQENLASQSTAVTVTNTGNLYSDTKNMNHTVSSPSNITITAVSNVKGFYDDNSTMTYDHLTTRAVSDSNELIEMTTVRFDLGNVTYQQINDNLTTKINTSLQQQTTAANVEKEKNDYVNSTRDNIHAVKKLENCETLLEELPDIEFLNNSEKNTFDRYNYTHYYNCSIFGGKPYNINLHTNTPKKRPSSLLSVVKNFFIIVVCILIGLCVRHAIRNRQRKRNIYLYEHASIPMVHQL